MSETRRKKLKKGKGQNDLKKENMGTAKEKCCNFSVPRFPYLKSS